MSIKELPLQETRKKAEDLWEDCHHLDNFDRQFWINGFMRGYLHACGQDDVKIVAILSEM